MTASSRKEVQVAKKLNKFQQLVFLFPDSIHGQFIPRNPEKIAERPPNIDPGFCSVHNLKIEFWCYEDDSPLCMACRLYSHNQHEVTRYTDKNKEQLSQLYEACMRQWTNWWFWMVKRSKHQMPLKREVRSFSPSSNKR